MVPLGDGWRGIFGRENCVPPLVFDLFLSVLRLLCKYFLGYLDIYSWTPKSYGYPIISPHLNSLLPPPPTKDYRGTSLEIRLALTDARSNRRKNKSYQKHDGGRTAHL